jgi:hypothetical protein
LRLEKLPEIPLHLPQNLLQLPLRHLLLGLLLHLLLAELLGLLFVELFVELQLLPFGKFLLSTQYKLFVTKFALHHSELPLV